MKIEFISYNGKFPNLCRGELVFAIDGKEYSLNPHSLISGGSVTFDENWEENIFYGTWKIDEDELPEEIRKYKIEILEMINSNIKWGCCGGCV